MFPINCSKDRDRWRALSNEYPMQGVAEVMEDEEVLYPLVDDISVVYPVCVSSVGHGGSNREGLTDPAIVIEPCQCTGQ